MTTYRKRAPMSYEVKYSEEFAKRTIAGIEETKRMHEEFLQDAQRDKRQVNRNYVRVTIWHNG